MKDKTSAEISLAAALDFACEQLPEDWTIRVDASRGEIDVVLVDPDGLTLADIGDGRDPLAMIVDRVNEARAADGLCPVDLDGEHDTEWRDAESRACERELFGGDQGGEAAS
jgi:hypothetical protein